MSTQVTLTFAGDPSDAVDAINKVNKSLDSIDKSTKSTSQAVDKLSKDSKSFGDRMDGVGNAISGIADAVDVATGALDALSQVQNAGREKANRLAHATNDLAQANEDLQQATRDASQAQIDAGQAQIDLEQANLNASVALKEYNKAVKEHGKGSDEAKQAALDLKQAQQDVSQAQEDGKQAARDLAQSTLDVATATQDAKEANQELHPPHFEQWVQAIEPFIPLAGALASVITVLTAQQWLWNASLWASPVTWIVLAIVALVAIIVLLATKTQFFQTVWDGVWGFLKSIGAWFAGPFADFFVAGYHIVMNYLGNLWSYIQSIPGMLKNAFEKVTNFIFFPFKTAFNLVASAWNGTIGRLHWTVPGWVPGIGGNSISAPTLPKFHQGGIASGALGGEFLAVLQAGERVTASGGATGGAGGEDSVELTSDGTALSDWVLSMIRQAIGARGNDPVRVLRSASA